MRILLLATALLLVACQAPRDGLAGRYTETLAVPVEQLHNAFEKALWNQGVHVAESQADAYTAVIKGSFADKTSYTIRIERLSAESCEVGIQVGTFGDEQRAKGLLDSARKGL
jgi:hypothetical protein